MREDRSTCLKTNKKKEALTPSLNLREPKDAISSVLSTESSMNIDNLYAESMKQLDPVALRTSWCWLTVILSNVTTKCALENTWSYVGSSMFAIEVIVQ